MLLTAPGGYSGGAFIKRPPPDLPLSGGRKENSNPETLGAAYSGAQVLILGGTRLYFFALRARATSGGQSIWPVIVLTETPESTWVLMM